MKIASMNELESANDKLRYESTIVHDSYKALNEQNTQLMQTNSEYSL